MNVEALNKKLAEWVFPPPEFKVVKVYPDFIAVDKRYSEQAKAYLKEKSVGVEEWYRHENLPIFTESLDACFRWLVPGLYQFTSLPDVNFCCPYNEDEGYLCSVVDDSGGEILASAGAETPALAFCLAVEKLIDGGVPS